MKKSIVLVLIIAAFIIGIGFNKIISSSNSDQQTAAVILGTEKSAGSTTAASTSKNIAVSPGKPVDVSGGGERKLRITVVNGQCIYQIRNWIFGSWNIVQVSTYDTGVGACPGLQSVL